MISLLEYANTRNVRPLFGNGRFLWAGTNVQAGRDCEKISRRVCVGYITFSNFGGSIAECVRTVPAACAAPPSHGRRQV